MAIESVTDLVRVPAGVPVAEALLVCVKVAAALALAVALALPVTLAAALPAAPLAVPLAVAVPVVGSRTPAKLKPSDAEYAVQVPEVARNTQGSAQGAACPSTGHPQMLALAALPHLMVVLAPFITSAYRVVPCGTAMGVASVSVVHT